MGDRTGRYDGTAGIRVLFPLHTPLVCHSPPVTRRRREPRSGATRRERGECEACGSLSLRPVLRSLWSLGRAAARMT